MKKSNSGLQTFFKKLYNSNLALLIFSFLLSIVIWSVVKFNFSDSTTRRLSDIKVSVDTSLAESNGYYAFYDKNDVVVDVEISGKSYTINSSSFSENDISLSASSGYVESAGYKTMTITANSTNPNVVISSVTPSTIKVYFDQKETRSFNVEARVNNSTDPIDQKSYLDDKNTELYIGRYTPSVSTVEVEGPSKAIDEIKNVIFNANIKESELPLLETKEIEASVDYDMDSSYLKTFLKCTSIDDETSPAKVTVPVTKLVTVPVVVNFVNQPKALEESDISYRITPSTVRVSCPSNETIDKLVIGTIDFKELENSSKHFEIKSKDITSITTPLEVESFDVRVDLSSYSKKEIKITDVSSNVFFTGQNSKFSYSVDESLTVTVYGPKDVLDGITEENFQIEINVSKLTSKGTSQKVKDLTVTIDSDQCWISDLESCLVTVS